MGQEDIVLQTLLEIKEEIGSMKSELGAAVKDYGERIDNHDSRIVKLEEAMLKNCGAKEARKPFWSGCWDIAKMMIVFGLGLITEFFIKGNKP